MNKLKDEHARSILFAEEMLRIARQGTDIELADGIEKVRQYNIDELESHLQHEEQTILRPLLTDHPEHIQLCVTIGKEHGFMRTLVESMSFATARKDLADFGQILKSHSLMEDQELFPLVEKYFTEEQLQDVLNFSPLQRGTLIVEQSENKERKASFENSDKWLLKVKNHLKNSTQKNAHIVLFHRYNPELNKLMAAYLGLRYFDYQKEVMQSHGPAAEAIALDDLEKTIHDEARSGGVVLHNTEALLCVKTEEERRVWLSAFLERPWSNPVLLPIMVFHEAVPAEHQNVCDIELNKVPRITAGEKTAAWISEPENRIKYQIEGIF